MFKLSRQISTPDIDRIIVRELNRQNFVIRKASKKILQEIYEVSQEIEKEELPHRFVRKKLPGQLGEGVFLKPDATPIEKGTVIAAYAGEVSIVPQNEPDDCDYAFAPLNDIYLNKEEQKFYDSSKKFSPRRLYSIKLDAYAKGNFTRSINHSEDPNIYAETIEIGKNSFGMPLGSLEVVYFAKKKINPGEQLLVSYEGEKDSYWEACDYEQIPMFPNTFQIDNNYNLIT